jgi:hypothetical protein
MDNAVSRFPENSSAHRSTTTNMSIYLTKNVQFASKVEAFERRGLAGQVSVKAAESGVLSIEPQSLASILRYNNIHEELPARLDGQHRQYRKVPKLTNVLSRMGDPAFEAPTLIVEMKTGGEALNSLGMYEAATGKMGLYAGKPNLEQIRQICSMNLDMYSTVPAGNVNISGYLAYIMAWRGIRALFAMGGGESATDKMICHVNETGGRRVQGVASTNAVVDEKGALVKEGSAGKPPGGNILLEEFTPITSNVVAVPGLRVLNPLTAGDLDDGHVFPFFREMLDGDPDTTFNIFITYFKSCIANSVQEMGEALVLYRRGFRYLASTTAGKIVQHIYFGLKLAIECSGTFSIISDGAEYAGFIIETENPILVKNRVVAPLGNDEIHIELSKLNSHANAIKKIFAVLIEIGRNDGEEEDITEESLMTNPRLLRDMILARPGDIIQGIREVINNHVADLKYNQNYWPITQENLVAFLSKMNSRAPINEEPMYVHIDVLTGRSSNILSYLSVFGAQAPSIYHGDTTKVISPLLDEDPNLAMANGKRAVPHIPYTTKGLIAAANDWASVMRSKTFKYKAPRPRKGGQIAGFSAVKGRDGIISNPHFDSFYTLLRTWVHGEAVAVADRKGKKREADAMDTGDGGSRKKRVFTFI